VAGTPLYEELSAKGLMMDESEIPLPDMHGQYKFNFRHANIRDGQEEEFLVRAFDRDFAVNGPSVVRTVRTLLAGWKRHKNHPSPRVRRRLAWEARELSTSFAALVAGARRFYVDNPALAAQASELVRDIHREFGLKSRLFTLLGGPYVHWRIRREEKRLAAGHTYEPPTFYDRNAAVADNPQAEPCRYVTPTVVPQTLPVYAAPPVAMPVEEAVEEPVTVG